MLYMHMYYRLEEIDNNLREIRKDGSTGNTPLSVTDDHTPICSPHTSPNSKRKSGDRLMFSKTSPLLGRKKNLAPPSWLSQSTDYEVLARKQRHKRQFSDSVALPVGFEVNSDACNEVSKEDISDELMIRRHIDGVPMIHSHSVTCISDSGSNIGSTHSSSNNIAKNTRSSSDTATTLSVKVESAHSSSVSLNEYCDVHDDSPLTDGSTDDHHQGDVSSKTQLELVSTLRNGAQSDLTMSVLHVEDADLLSKLRGVIQMVIVLIIYALY